MRSVNMSANEYPKINLRELKNKEEDFYNGIKPIMYIYSTSDMMKEISELARKNENIKPLNLGSFSYQDEYVFSYLPKNKVESASIAYSRGSQTKNPLMDYEYMAVENSRANSFGVVKFNGKDDATAYVCITEANDIDKKTKKKLYKDIELLAKGGVTFPMSALFYNSKNGEIKILDYSDVSINGFETLEDRNHYLEIYRRMLSL